MVKSHEFMHHGERMRAYAIRSRVTYVRSAIDRSAIQEHCLPWSYVRVCMRVVTYVWSAIDRSDEVTLTGSHGCLIRNLQGGGAAG